METLIGIDLGTSGVRVEVYDLEGESIAVRNAAVSRQTVEEWLGALRAASPSDAIEQFAPGDKIVTVDSTSGTVLLVDDRGRPVFQPIMYHEKAAEEYEGLKGCGSVREIAEKGVSISPTSPLPKIVHAMRTSPEKFRRVRWILPPASWILYRLRFREGERWDDVCVDCANALKFGEDIESKTWFAPVFEDAGVPTGLLPGIVDCGSPAGEAGSALAESIGLKGARLFHGTTDGNASAIATGCIRPGDFGIGCGTTTVPKYVCEEIRPHPAIYYHRHPVQGYLAGAAPVTCGMLEWLSDRVFGIPIEESFSLAERAEPGSEYMYFPQGDRSPFDDPSLGVSLLGLWPEDLDKDVVRGRIFRSAMTGIAFLEYYYISLFEELFGRRIDEVKLAGGAARNQSWNRLRASIYGRPVKILEKHVAVGALIPVALKLGLYRDPDEATGKLLRVIGYVEPDAELGAKYRGRRDLFMDRWKALQRAYRA